MKNEVIFAPSLMCIDFMNAYDDVKVLEKHFGMLHADIMDGHFAPNITLSPGFVESVKKITKLPVDAHLMVEHPNDYIDTLAKAGADYITVHAETIIPNAFRTINRIKESGAKPGVALCPATPLEVIDSYIDMIDLLLIMTVDIGYAGQRFIPQMMKKIEHADRLRTENGYNFLIQVDGCIGKDVYKKLFDNGVNVYVMGTAGLFEEGMSLDAASEKMQKEFFLETGVCQRDSNSK